MVRGGPALPGGMRHTLCVLFGLTLLVGLVTLSGIYNIAASRGHLAVTRAFLELGMRRSVALHSRFVDTTWRPADLARTDLVRLGAAHYAQACAGCHGAPGQPAHPVTQAMLPAPPALWLRVPAFDERELFWIVRHGLKYTGMPAWPASGRDDEVWVMVAFLQRLPELSATDYAALVGGLAVDATPAPAAARPVDAGLAALLPGCVPCHGDARRRPASPRVPVLHRQKAAYLEQALAAYAEGQRPSGIMQAAAAGLSATQIRALAAHYHGLPRPRESQVGGDPALARSGAKIAAYGIPAQGVPACHACHRADSLALYPRLEGQPAEYLALRLQLWRQGRGPTRGPGAIMAPIAARLEPAQIDALAAHFAAAALDHRHPHGGAAQ